MSKDGCSEKDTIYGLFESPEYGFVIATSLALFNSYKIKSMQKNYSHKDMFSQVTVVSFIKIIYGRYLYKKTIHKDMLARYLRTFASKLKNTQAHITNSNICSARSKPSDSLGTEAQRRNHKAISICKDY